MMFVVSGVTFLRESGVLRDRPEPQYLSDEEAELRPVYGQLTKSEKAAYEALYRGISEMKEEIPLPRDLDGETYSKLYCLVEKQEAELFYVNSEYYTAEIVGDAKIMYREDAKAVEEKQLELSVAVKKALNMIGGAKSETELARRIHDYIIRHCAYNIGKGMPYSSTAYGCLVDGEANCEGYAKAFNLLASRLGLRSVLVTGTTDDGENHAWNQVNIDGQWYNVDVTWDDADVSGVVRRTYFLCDDEEFRRRHIADNELFESFKCGDDSRDYYVSNDLLADSYVKAEEIVRREMKKGGNEIQIKFADEELFDGFGEHFIDNHRIFDIAVECGADRGGSLAVTLEENRKNLCITVFLGRG
ncbi:MAG: hypothetical protein IJ487_03525 [Ruminococcus sp.]|nr:hypothetical protein [Ruminococcus sp.]